MTLIFFAIVTAAIIAKMLFYFAFEGTEARHLFGGIFGLLLAIAAGIGAVAYSFAAWSWFAAEYKTDIIKGDKIVFSSTEDNSSIVKSENGNGFYVEWNNPKYQYSRCCEEGLTRTRFAYKSHQFIPIYEQEVRYLKIGKRDY